MGISMVLSIAILVALMILAAFAVALVGKAPASATGADEARLEERGRWLLLAAVVLIAALATLTSVTRPARVQSSEAPWAPSIPPPTVPRLAP
ncbi:MAG: hypothetical protein ACK4N5_12985 [Myxococcales bacterium]